MAGPDNKGFHRGRGDATHKDVLELSVGGEGTGTFARQLHIAQAGDLDSDWAIAAQAHPMLVLHSVTTPITDYVTLQHDGTTAKLNSAGGSLGFGAVGSFVFNETSCDVDFRIEGDSNNTLLFVDAGLDAIGFGATVTAGAFITLTPATTTRDMVTAVGSWLHIPADSQDINAAGNCATIAVGAAIYIGVPTWTSTATGLTLTDSAALHVAGKPVDSTNVTNTREYGILVECGGLGLGIPGGTTGCLRIAGGTSGVVTLTVAAAAGTYSLELPNDDGCCGEQLTTNGTGTLTWAAASRRELKCVQGLTCRRIAFDNILNAQVYDYTYKPEIAAQGHWTGGGKVMTGIMAEESPWAMQGIKKGAFSPINAFGQLTAAFQVLADKVAVLEGA